MSTQGYECNGSKLTSERADVKKFRIKCPDCGEVWIITDFVATACCPRCKRLLDKGEWLLGTPDIEIKITITNHQRDTIKEETIGANEGDAFDFVIFKVGEVIKEYAKEAFPRRKK